MESSLHLCTSSEDEKTMELLLDEDEDPITPTESDVEILEIIDEDIVSFSNRIVQDRISNPHGEHAEDCWIIYNFSAVRGEWDEGE